MGIIAKMRRERTNAGTKIASQVFNASGALPLVYGKHSLLVGGRGQSGNATVPSTVANYNSPTGGNYAGTNPGSGGNYAGSNPSSPGSLAGYNPTTGGNYAGTNPPTGGNVSGYNEPSLGNANPGNWTPTPQDGPANAYFNWIPGNANYNPTSPGTAYYNPRVPGNAYYNPPVSGSAYYNPYYPGNAYYNPSVPGNANYNPRVPGTPGANQVVLGVYFPGGAADQAAPLVGDTLVKIAYSATPVPINLNAGSYVTVKQI